MTQTDFHQMFDLMPQASMTLDRNLVFKNANQAYCRAVRMSRDELIGTNVFAAFPDADQRQLAAKAGFVRTLEGHITRQSSFPYQLHGPDGKVEDRLWDVENQPLYSVDGEIIGLVQYCEDVTEREALRKERDLVSAELMHRVRNTMAIVQSVAQHTGEVSDSIGDFMKSFSGRLMAMDRNFSALSEANWQGLDLRDVLSAELEPFISADSDRLKIDGPSFQLSIKSTKDASMIFHELATNAAKHGFLTQSTGSLSVAWTFDGEFLTVTWDEFGMLDLAPPTREGFGFQMMDMFPNLSFSKSFSADGIRLSAKIPANIVAGQMVFTHRGS